LRRNFIFVGRWNIGWLAAPDDSTKGLEFALGDARE
jgi:hypothetical protein